jgi:hypothetical protein
MGTLNVAIPEKALTSPITWYKTRVALKGQIEATWEKYKDIIKNVSKLTKVDEKMILGIIMIESNGKPEVGNFPTVGLMQWNANNVSAKVGNAILPREFLKNRLSEEEKKLLAKYKITFDSKTGFIRPITEKDQIKPELNILIGAIWLGQLVDSDWATDSEGFTRVDRIISMYNWGLGGFNKQKIGTKSKADVLASIPASTKQYVAKMIGKNGVMDIMTSDLETLFT